MTARRTQQIHEAVAILRDNAITATLKFTSSPGDARLLAKEAVAAGSELIIVCGGDGTINEVLNGMTPSRIPLGILPGGTANIVAKELGLPENIKQAARELPGWQPCRITLGRAGWQESGSRCQRYFMAVAGVGFDAHIVSRLNVPMKLRTGVVAYGWEAIRQTFRYGFPRFQCTVNGSTVNASFAVIQRSGRYAGWLHLVRPRSILEPEFSCCHFESSNRWRYFLYALAVLTQTHYRLRDVGFFRSSHICCTGSKPEEVIHFEVDGEMAGQLPATFETVPDALTLLAPASFVVRRPAQPSSLEP